jgi:hypothetical protein
VAIFICALDELAIVGVFPHGKFGTGSAPGVHHFRVGAIAFSQPLEQIEDEWFERVRHVFSFAASINISVHGNNGAGNLLDMLVRAMYKRGGRSNPFGGK